MGTKYNRVSMHLKSLPYIFKTRNIWQKPLCRCGTVFYLKIYRGEENRDDLLKWLAFPSKSWDLQCRTFQMNVADLKTFSKNWNLIKTKQLLTIRRRLRFQLVDMHLFLLKLVIRVFQRVSKIDFSTISQIDFRYE